MKNQPTKFLQLTAAVGVHLVAAICNCEASLFFTISGQAGSAVVDYVATGSYVVNTATDATSSSFMEMPLGGQWSKAPDGNIGSFTAVSNANLQMDNGVTWLKNGSPFAGDNPVFEIDITNSNTAGGDDFEIEPAAGSLEYPGFNGTSDVLSWSGTGTFTLSGGMTFDDFTPGTYTNGIDFSGGMFVLEVSESSAVPESTPALIVGAFLIAAAALRRTRRA